MAAADTSKAGATADSYIGSLISLTSKCEIRYEGVLYKINTEESSIGLRNVRSFGTEGRKKDGQQIPPSDKIYEYILFRGSDIKDLQVKSSPPPPPVQAAPHIQDPAIIQQSQYSRPSSSSSTSLPSVGSGTTMPDLSSHMGQPGITGTTFQANLPLYQSGGSAGSWGSSPPTANGSGLGMPMYWQGFYPPSGGLPNLQQPSLLRPPPGLPMPATMRQPLQYPGFDPSLPSISQNVIGTDTLLPSGSLHFPGSIAPLPSGSSNLPEIPSSLLPSISGILSLSSTTMSSNVAPTQSTKLGPEMAASTLPSKSLVASTPALTFTTSLPFLSASTPDLESSSAPISSKPRTVPGQNLTYQPFAQPVSSSDGLFSSLQGEAPTPSLVTPVQLFQSGPSTISSSQLSSTIPKEKEINTLTSEPPKSSLVECKEPILPLPAPQYQKRLNAASLSHRTNRVRGRGNGYSRPLTKFTEDFDFTAMNEKFKKDEVWGQLGKGKAQLRDNREGDEYYDNNDYVEEEEDAGSSEIEIKPVYVKDDFFDTLSSNASDRGIRNGRTKFSEQLKIDTETFGSIPRHHANWGGGGRGGRGFHGGRGRASYFGRGYGYTSRGRGPPAAYYRAT